jgi:hypothetical protein
MSGGKSEAYTRVNAWLEARKELDAAEDSYARAQRTLESTIARFNRVAHECRTLVSSAQPLRRFMIGEAVVEIRDAMPAPSIEVLPLERM